MQENHKIRVLYLFDKYLNSTMNWAHRLMIHTPEIQPIIASPLIVKNEFYDANFEYIFSPFQIQKIDDEWSVSIVQKGINYVTNKHLGLYKRHLIKEIKRQKVDLIHVYFGNVAADYLDVLEEAGVPFVVSFLGYDFFSILNSKTHLKAKYLRLFALGNGFITLGNFGKNNLIKLGCTPEKIEIVRLAIEPDKIPFWKRKKQTESLKILQACTITEKKGHIYALSAFAKAIKNCPNMIFEIAGEPDNIEILRELNQIIEQNNLQNKVTIKGIYAYQDLIESAKQFDIFLHPSCWSKSGDCEGGTPVVIQDMMATGLPIISSIHADIPEGVLHGENGLLAEEQDVETLVRHIERFYKMGQEEFDGFAENGRKHVLENYSVEESGERLWRLYKKIMPF